MSGGRSLSARVFLLLLAAWLLAGLVGQERRLHGDEAFFLTFARNAAVRGDWWLLGDLDKPPLVIYGQALGLMAFGVISDAQGVLHLDAAQGEFVGRWVGAAFGLVALALLLRLGGAAGLWAALILLATPAWRQYSASAFMDMPMLALSLGAALLLQRARWGVAGLLAALAFACKPQAALLWPALALVMPRWRGRGLLVALLGLGLGLLALWAWDAARPWASVFALGAGNNAAFGRWRGPEEALAWSLEWGAALLRLSDPLGPGPLFLAGLALWRARRSRRAWALALWALAFSALHILPQVAHYERYALPLALLLAWPAGLTLARWRRWRAPLALGLVSLALLPQAPLADFQPQGDFIGAADFLNAQPIASVIYAPWHGWHLDYYLGPWTNKRRVYYPTPAAFVAGVLALDERGTRYFVSRSGMEDEQAWLGPLGVRGWRVELVWRDAQALPIWRLVPP
jgi:4-amino-4-deoxy-L-arabinose transferase-like glycosyltransferase